MPRKPEDKPKWRHQPLELVAGESGMPRSPAGRPYSPYPYRDLPDTAKGWEAQPTPALCTGTKQSFDDNGRVFHWFGSLPIELRLQIWREAVLETCQHGRVHRVGLAITESINELPKLELVATSQLTNSTKTTRALLSTCQEARQEALTYLGVAPDILPLHGGFTLRCDTSHDVIMLEGMTPELFLQIHALRRHTNPSLLAHLSSIHHLGLDLADPSQLEHFLTPAGLAPELATAFVSFTASFPKLKQIYFLQPTATLDPHTQPHQDLKLSCPSSASSSTDPADPITIANWYATTSGAHAPDHFFPGNTIPTLGTNTNSTTAPPTRSAFSSSSTAPSSRAMTSTASNSRSSTTSISTSPTAIDWYTTRPAQSYWVDADAYYLHLARLMRLICELRQALDDPPALEFDAGTPGTDGSGLLDGIIFGDGQDGEGVLEVLERLQWVRLRVLRHYVVVVDDMDEEGGSGDGEGQGEGRGDRGGLLLLSSPEKCLEVGLGREPRWVQWEWVCQCLDC